jgi:hypothetical protein
MNSDIFIDSDGMIKSVTTGSVELTPDRLSKKSVILCENTRMNEGATVDEAVTSDPSGRRGMTEKKHRILQGIDTQFNVAAQLAGFIPQCPTLLQR